MKPSQKEQEKLPLYSILDSRNKNDRIIKAKIPKFLYDEWKDVKSKRLIGKLVVETLSDGTEKTYMVLNDQAHSQIPAEKIPGFLCSIDGMYRGGQYAFQHTPTTGHTSIKGRIEEVANLTAEDTRLFRECSQFKDKRKEEDRPKYEIKSATQKKEVVTQFEKRNKVPVREKREMRIKKSEQQMFTEIFEYFNENPEPTTREVVQRIDQPQDYVESVLSKLASFDQKDKVWRRK